MKNEKTGKKAAGIAGRVLGDLRRSGIFKDSGRVYAENIFGNLVLIGGRDNDLDPPTDHLNVGGLCTLAGSALTQAPDKRKKGRA